MDTFGNDLGMGGQVLSREELIKKRKRSGLCPTCGQKIFKKKLFKLEPITTPGKVLNGRCLACKPQDPTKGEELVASCAPVVAHKSKSMYSRCRSSRNGLSSTHAAPPAESMSRAQTAPRSSFGENDLSTMMPRRNSQNSNSFLKRQMPRPSAIFLDGINIEDLFSEDEDEDSSDNFNTKNNNNSRYSDNGTGHNAPSSPTISSSHNNSKVVSQLSRDERQALQTLNSSSKHNSFLDIVNIMLLNSLSAPVQNEGLHALSLVHDPEVELLEECASSCGFEVIVSAMGMCSKDAMAQTNACKVLFIASATSEELQIAIGEAGGIAALVDAMKEFGDDTIVLEGCLLALSNLCIPDENLDKAVEGEMIELAVNAMSQNVENCGLQEHGCAVVANLGVHEDARRRIRDCGGCDTVVVSMVVNPMDVGVQCQAMVAIRNLCVRDDDNKVLLANAGAIDVIIQAMQNHRDDPQVQARATWALGVIGMNEDNKLYIGENGGADAIIRSMWVHSHDLGVHEKACRALWTLSVHPDNRYTMVGIDAIAAVVTSMQNHASEPNIQERGCGVLCNMAADNDDIKIRIVDEGALEVIVMAMVLHGENEMIQERAVALLHKLCIRENIEKMVNANVSPMMAVVAENFPECQEKASFVLSKLSA